MPCKLNCFGNNRRSTTQLFDEEARDHLRTDLDSESTLLLRERVIEQYEDSSATRSSSEAVAPKQDDGCSVVLGQKEEEKTLASNEIADTIEHPAVSRSDYKVTFIKRTVIYYDLTMKIHIQSSDKEVIATIPNEDLAKVSENSNNTRRSRNETIVSKKKEYYVDRKLLHYMRCNRNRKAKSMLNRRLAKLSDGSRYLLHYAAEYDNEVIARYLIKLGSPIDPLEADTHNTPLAIAVQNNCFKVIEVLLEKKANIEKVLHIVFRGCYEASLIKLFYYQLKSETSNMVEFVERLQKAGGSLYHAVCAEDLKIVKYMLQSGFDINHRHTNDLSVLHAAVEVENLQLLKFLIHNGANVNAKCQAGASPLLNAALKCNAEMSELLLERGADPNSYSHHYQSNILFAMFAFKNRRTFNEEKRIDCIELLLQHGASPTRSIEKYIHSIYDYAVHCQAYNSITSVIAEMALRDMRGTSDIIYINCKCNINLTEFENYYDTCIRTLKKSGFGRLCLFHLMSVSDVKIKSWLRRKKVAARVDISLKMLEDELCKTVPYYIKILKRRFLKAKLQLKLEDTAIRVIGCKLFDGDYKLCYKFAQTVVGYLSQRDLEHLSQV